MELVKQLKRVAAATAIGLAAAGSASANYLTDTNLPGNFAFGAGTPVLIQSLNFANAAGQRFVVTFSAECAVAAPAGNTTAWTDVDVQVVNAATGLVVQTLSPSIGTADAFCSANGTAVYDGWVRGSITLAGGLGLPAGVYRIQVIGRLNNLATGASYGDRALVISR
jgi:hypothetical protein